MCKVLNLECHNFCKQSEIFEDILLKISVVLDILISCQYRVQSLMMEVRVGWGGGGYCLYWLPVVCRCVYQLGMVKKKFAGRVRNITV